jgi:hypothetical protein
MGVHCDLKRLLRGGVGIGPTPMPKARRHSDGLGSGLARARGVAAGLLVESKWTLTIKSVVSQGDKFCLPRRQILSPTETDLNLSPRETDFVPGRDRVSNGTVVRGGGVDRFEMSAPRRYARGPAR